VVHGGLADDDVADAGFHLDARGRVLCSAEQRTARPRTTKSRAPVTLVYVNWSPSSNVTRSTKFICARALAPRVGLLAGMQGHHPPGPAGAHVEVNGRAPEPDVGLVLGVKAPPLALGMDHADGGSSRNLHTPHSALNEEFEKHLLASAHARMLGVRTCSDSRRNFFSG